MRSQHPGMGAPVYSYDTIRPWLATGTVILWQGDDLLGWAIRLFTEFSHASLVVRELDPLNAERVDVIEALATGLEMRHLSERMKGHPGRVFAFRPLDLGATAQARVKSFALDECGKGVRYDYAGLFANWTQEGDSIVQTFADGNQLVTHPDGMQTLRIGINGPGNFSEPAQETDTTYKKSSPFSFIIGGGPLSMGGLGDDPNALPGSPKLSSDISKGYMQYCEDRDSLEVEREMAAYGLGPDPVSQAQGMADKPATSESTPSSSLMSASFPLKTNTQEPPSKPGDSVLTGTPGKGLEAAKNAVGEAIGSVSNAASQAVDNAKDIAQNTAKGVGVTVSKAVDAVKDGVGKAADAVGEGAGQAVDAAKYGALGAINTVMSSTGKEANAATTQVTGKEGDSKTGDSSLMDKVKTVSKAAKEAASNLLVNALTGKNVPKNWKYYDGIPPGAVLYRTPDGQTFYAPPGIDFEAIFKAGQANGIDPVGALNALYHYGIYDVQRDITDDQATFYSEYTNAANYVVGLYMKGAGVTLEGTHLIAGVVANIISSNANKGTQEPWWTRGWNAGATGSFATPVGPPDSSGA